MISRLELMTYRYWHGPFKRPLRALARRLTNSRSGIICGPLKGMQFTGQELACRMGIYELHVQYALEELLSDGDVFFDVGANNGYLTLLGAHCIGSRGFAYAFEPLPQNAHRVQILMSENRIENYQLVQKAVSNCSGLLELYLGDDRDPYTPSLIRDHRREALKVDATTLDDFAVQNRRPHVIKMDIEGAEVMALEGASTLLSSKDAPKWLIETHSNESDDLVSQILLKHSYRLSWLPAPLANRPHPAHIIAVK